MRAQQIYDNVVLPFMDATRKAGIPAASVARIVGVSRGTPYFWEKQRFMPNEDMQKLLITLTEKINVALENEDLPLVFDYDAELRRVLEVKADVVTGATE